MQNPIFFLKINVLAPLFLKKNVKWNWSVDRGIKIWHNVKKYAYLHNPQFSGRLRQSLQYRYGPQNKQVYSGQYSPYPDTHNIAYCLVFIMIMLSIIIIRFNDKWKLSWDLAYE